MNARTLLTALGAHLLAPAALAQCESFDVTQSGTSRTGVALEGDRLLIGESFIPASPGQVQLARLAADGTITQQGVLLDPALEIDRRFGADLAARGERLLVGAPIQNGVGLAHIFHDAAGGYVLEETLVDPTPHPQNFFGLTVAFDDDLAVVGAPLDSVGLHPNAGSVHVYERIGASWVYTTRLTAPGAAPFDSFGWSLSTGNGRIVVGAPGRHVTGPNQGAAFVFERTAAGWDLGSPLNPGPMINLARLGTSVAIDGNSAVVGASGAETVAGITGAAFAFLRSSFGWQLVEEMTPLDGRVGTEFGLSLDLRGGRLAIGRGAMQPGAGLEIYGLGCQGWMRSHRIAAAPTGQPDWFSRSLAVGYDRIAVLDQDWVAGVGLTCTLGRTSCDPAFENSTGLAGRLRLTGSASAGANALSFAVSQVAPFQFGVALVSPTGGAFFPPPGGCFGMLCLHGPIARLSAQAQTSGAAGSVTFTPDLGALPAPLSTSVQAGETWHFQYWTRDTAPSMFAQFTNAVSLTFE